MLELKNVSFSVGSADDELEIIDDISLTFDDGKFVVITGPNGGGKSTLAKLISITKTYLLLKILLTPEGKCK